MSVPMKPGRFVVKSRFVVDDKEKNKLGSGAFGTVYRASDKDLQREVALKILHPEKTDAVRVQRFQREARAAANLQHPHIVPVFDTGTDDGRHYIVSAFIDGQTLRAAIPQNGMEFDRAAQIVRQLAEALAHAHDEGFVHRDVKPDNIMLDKQDRVHLMDFGLVFLQEEGSPRAIIGRREGTPAYMSPEQVRGSAPEPAADQYSAGVVLYQLLTGALPFEGSKDEVYEGILKTAPELPSETRPNVPKDLEAIALKAMAKAPQDRYASCRELADDLRRWLEGEPITARRMGLRERAIRWVKREPKLAGALALIVAVLLINGGLIANYARQAVEDRKQTAQLYQEAEEARDREAKKAVAEEAAKKRAEASDAERAKIQKKLLGETQNLQEAQRKADAFLAQVEIERATIAYLQDKLRGEQQKLKDAQAKCSEERDKLLRQLRLAEQEVAALAESLRQWSVLREFPVPLADVAQRLNHIKAATGLLLTVAPKDRGWHWQHIGRLCGMKDPAIAPALQSKVGRPIAFSPNGDSLVAVASEDDKVARVWDTKTGTKVLDLKCQAPLDALAFSPEWKGGGKGVVTVERDGARVWVVQGTVRGVKTGESVRMATGRIQAREVAFVDPPEASKTSDVWWWRVVTVHEVIEDEGISNKVKKGESVWVWGDDTIFVPQGGVAKDVTGRMTYPAKAGLAKVVAVSPDGARVFAKEGAERTIWETYRGSPTNATNKVDQGALTAAFATRPGRNGEYRLATMGAPPAKGAPEVIIWNAQTGEKIVALENHAPGIRALAFSGDEERVVTVSATNTVAVWSIKAGTTKTRDATVLEKDATSVALSPDGERAVIAREKTVSVWNTESRKTTLSLDYPERVTAVRWNAKGTHLVVELANGELHVLSGPVP